MVCIIDDREDVWSHASNLIHVKPYHFFQHTGDINAPPGLDKHEEDDKTGVDLSNLGNTNKIHEKDGDEADDEEVETNECVKENRDSMKEKDVSIAVDVSIFIIC